MNALFRLLPAIVAALLALGRASLVLAHEGELHLTEGVVLTPLTIAILGGTLAGFLLTGFLLWRWASASLKRKEAQQRQLQSSASETVTSGTDDRKQER